MIAMKKSILFFIFLVAASTASIYAQQLVKVWETAPVLKTPESVIYCPGNDQIYVANINGNASEKDGNGFISILSSKGEVVNLEWVSGLHAPKGMGIYDGKLYVADIEDRKIWRYDIHPDGTLKNKNYFAPHGSDGMTIDNRGNIYLTMGKVWVYSPEGELISEIDLPEHPSNICFGGKNRDILFITARSSVYTLKMNVRGVQ